MNISGGGAMRIGLKRALCLIAAGLLCLPLAGCTETVQMNRRAIVQAVGLDLEEDGQLKLTLQIFAPAVEGSGGISASADNARIIQSKGKTVADAVQNAALLQGKELFMGHNRVIVLGDSLARRDVEQPLRYFAGDPTVRQNVCLALAKNRAEDVLTSKITQGILPAEILEKLLKNAQEVGLAVHMELYAFLKALESGYESPLAPVLEAAPAKEEAGGESARLEPVSALSVTGTGVFQGGRLAGTVGLETSRGLLWLRGDLNRTVLTVSSGKYQSADLRLTVVRAALRPELSDGELRFRLRVEAEAAVDEPQLRPGFTEADADWEELALAGEAAIRRECQTAFSLARRYQADPFGMGSLVWQRNVYRWRTLRETWPAPLGEADLQVEARITLQQG